MRVFRWARFRMQLCSGNPMNRIVIQFGFPKYGYIIHVYTSKHGRFSERAAWAYTLHWLTAIILLFSALIVPQYATHRELPITLPAPFTVATQWTNINNSLSLWVCIIVRCAYIIGYNARDCWYLNTKNNFVHYYDLLYTQFMYILYTYNVWIL